MGSDSVNALPYVGGESIFLEPIFTVVSELGDWNLLFEVRYSYMF